LPATGELEYTAVYKGGEEWRSCSELGYGDLLLSSVREKGLGGNSKFKLFIFRQVFKGMRVRIVTSRFIMSRANGNTQKCERVFDVRLPKVWSESSEFILSFIDRLIYFPLRTKYIWNFKCNTFLITVFRIALFTHVLSLITRP